MKDQVLDEETTGCSIPRGEGLSTDPVLGRFPEPLRLVEQLILLCGEQNSECHDLDCSE